MTTNNHLHRLRLRYVALLSLPAKPERNAQGRPRLLRLQSWCFHHTAETRGLSRTNYHNLFGAFIYGVPIAGSAAF
jgi:hypothetical protein